MSESKAIQHKRDYVKEFREAFTGFLIGIEKAAKIYIDAIDQDPNYANIFEQEFGQMIPRGAWKKLEQIGRRTLHPKLLMGLVPLHNGIISRLPYAMQEKIVSGHKFELLTADNDVLKVDIMTMTSRQAKQLFAKDHVRTKPEQKAYMVEEALLAASQQVDQFVPYEIRKHDVYFKGNTILTFDELKRLALQLP